MQSINVNRSIRVRAALAAAALAIVGTGVAASPAQAAPAVQEPQHCVLVLPYQGVAECFPTFEEAQQFGDRTDVGSANSPAAGRSAGSVAAVVLTRLSIEYDQPLWLLGSTLTLFGTNGPCTASLLNPDYQLSPMPAPPNVPIDWDDRVSSFITYSGCRVRHYDFANWTGPFVGYSVSQPVLVNGLDDDTDSLYIS